MNCSSSLISLTLDIAIESEQLSGAVPADPADQLIAATARVNELVLITSDRALRESELVRTLW